MSPNALAISSDTGPTALHRADSTSPLQSEISLSSRMPVSSHSLLALIVSAQTVSNPSPPSSLFPSSNTESLSPRSHSILLLSALRS